MFEFVGDSFMGFTISLESLICPLYEIRTRHDIDKNRVETAQNKRLSQISKKNDFDKCMIVDESFYEGVLKTIPDKY